MLIFLFAGILATLFAYLSSYYSNSKQSERNINWLFLSFFVMWFVASFQDCIGMDFANYKQLFNTIKQQDIASALFRTDRDQIEIGWYLLNKVLGVFDTFYAVTPVTYFVILYPIYKLFAYIPKKWHWITVFFFFFGIKFFLFEMSGLRQGLAVSFWILMAFAIKEKKWVKAIVFIILGSSFHNSYIYSIAFIPLLLIPYEKINFGKKAFLWVVIFAGLFTFGLLYVSRLIGTVHSLAFIFEDAENEAVYSAYIEEVEVYSRSVTNFISGLIFVLFIAYAFTSRREPRKYSNMFFTLFLFTYILEASMGGFGSLPRMLRYTGIFALPAIGNTADNLKGGWRISYVFYLLLITLYSFFTAVRTDQFDSYLNYHTIFF